MGNDKLDSEIDGQMSIEDLLDPNEKLIAVSEIFARARKNMTLAEQKTFTYALSQVRFKEKAKTNIVYLDKKKLAKILGIEADPKHISRNIHRAIRELAPHSFIEIADEDKDLYDDGTVVTRITMRERNLVRVKFESEYLPLFTELDSGYLTMWSSDIFGLKNIRSLQFYELLRQKTDVKKSVNSISLGIKHIKEMFNIPKDGKGSYMREKGGFNRTEFEKKVIDIICNDLQKTKMIQLVVNPDGKAYEKVKNGRKIDGYRFTWTFSKYPAVASANEVKQIQDRVDKDPEILKVAKDIIKGDSKKKERTGASSKNGFNNFQQRQYGNDIFQKLAQVDRPKKDE